METFNKEQIFISVMDVLDGTWQPDDEHIHVSRGLKSISRLMHLEMFGKITTAKSNDEEPSGHQNAQTVSDPA